MAEAPAGLAGALFTAHATAEMQRRGLSMQQVQRVLAAPEQWVHVRSGRGVCQSRIRIDGRLYLLRVFVDIDRAPLVVVTVYRSSKIAKYWSTH